MKKILQPVLTFIFFPLFLYSQESSVNKIPFLTITSDSTWMESSTVYGFSSMIFPWPGAILYPSDNTYTIPVQTGNTYHYKHIAPLEEAEAIVSTEDVHYFRKTFRIGEMTGISVRLRAYMDDNIEVRINNHVVARNIFVDENNFKGVPHDLVINSDNSRYNGFENHDAFDFVTNRSTSDIFTAGTNEIVVAVRNMRSNIGGFRMKMELIADSILLNPIGITENKPTALSGIDFYPNPAGNRLYIDLATHHEDFHLQLFGTNGTLVREHSLKGGGVAELNTSDLPGGIYLLRISQGRSAQTRKLMID